MPKRLVNSLPYDFSRCDPVSPDSYCRCCTRYSYVEGQTWGQRTPVMFGLENSTSDSCRYIAATWEEVNEAKEASEETDTEE